MIITAYQTLENRDNIDEIETDGPYICSRKDAWLGSGYYFWDSNIAWAISWGKNSYEKFQKEYVIGRCQLDLSQYCFDLFGNVAHQIDLKEVIEVMKRSGKIRSGHRLIMPNIIEFLKVNGLFPYRSIRIGDTPSSMHVHFSGQETKREYMLVNQRVQICVIERKGVILHPFDVIYPEKYLT